MSQPSSFVMCWPAREHPMRDVQFNLYAEGWHFRDAVPHLTAPVARPLTDVQMSSCSRYAFSAVDSLRGSTERGESEELGLFERSGAAHGSLSSKEALAGAPMAWRDLERLEARLQDRSLSFEERQRLKDMKHWRMIRPRPELPAGNYEEIANVALEFGENRIRVEELVRDPDRGGVVTDNSVDEARIALTMEREGRLREVIRDPRVGCGDLVELDGGGQEWDVYSPRGNRFDQEDVKGQLEDKIVNQRQDDRMMKVIVNCAYLSQEQVGEIEQIVEAEGWGALVVYSTSKSRG